LKVYNGSVVSFWDTLMRVSVGEAWGAEWVRRVSTSSTTRQRERGV